MKREDIVVGALYGNKQHPKGKYLGAKLASGRKTLIVTEAIDCPGNEVCSEESNPTFWDSFFYIERIQRAY